jgi:hypothetical protein
LPLEITLGDRKGIVTYVLKGGPLCTGTAFEIPIAQYFSRDVGHIMDSVLETANPRLKEGTDTHNKAIPSGECECYLL